MLRALCTSRLARNLHLCIGRLSQYERASIEHMAGCGASKDFARFCSSTALTADQQSRRSHIPQRRERYAGCWLGMYGLGMFAIPGTWSLVLVKPRRRVRKEPQDAFTGLTARAV